MWSRGHKARGQGQDQQPHKKKSEAKATDSPSRSQGQECSRPRPRIKDKGQVLSKKKGLQKNVFGDLQKKRFPKNFSGAPQTFNNSKNSVKDVQNRAIFEDLRLRGQGHQNVVLEGSTSGEN